MRKRKQKIFTQNRGANKMKTKEFYKKLGFNKLDLKLQKIKTKEETKC